MGIVNEAEWSYFDGPTRHVVCSRRSLSDEEHQEVFESAIAGGRWLFCGCRQEPVLRLIPYVLPRLIVTDRKRRIGLRRFRTSDPHLPGCFAGQLEAIFAPASQFGVDYTDAIFGAAQSRGEAAEDTERRQSVFRGHQYGDFTHFFQRMLTRASLEAFAEKNACRSYKDSDLESPSPDDIFKRLASILGEPLMYGGANSPTERLRSLGRRLVWGLTSQKLVEESDQPLASDELLQFQLGRHWDSEGQHPFGPLLDLTPDVLGRSRGNAKAMRHRIPPPYLYAAVFEPGENANRVYEFYRVPVFVTSDVLFLVESQSERRSLNFFARGGLALIKLPVRADLRTLGPNLWPWPTGYIPSRPDVIAFFEGRVILVYLTNTKLADYHEKLAKGIVAVKESFRGPEVAVGAVASDELNFDSWPTILRSL